MKKFTQIEQLRFEPRDYTFSARFTETEAQAIRKFCKDENIKYSDILRYSMKLLVPNF